jgi:hypothetical protein
VLCQIRPSDDGKTLAEGEEFASRYPGTVPRPALRPSNTTASKDSRPFSITMLSTGQRSALFDLFCAVPVGAEHALPIGLRAWAGAASVLIQSSMRVYRWVSLEHAGRRDPAARLSKLYDADGNVAASALHFKQAEWLSLLREMKRSIPPLEITVGELSVPVVALISWL